jgi:hypothetical protein
MSVPCQRRDLARGIHGRRAAGACQAGVIRITYRPNIGLDVLVCDAGSMAGQPEVTQRSMEGTRLPVPWMLPASPGCKVLPAGRGACHSACNGRVRDYKDAGCCPYTTQIGGSLMKRFLTRHQFIWGRP